MTLRVRHCKGCRAGRGMPACVSVSVTVSMCLRSRASLSVHVSVLACSNSAAWYSSTTLLLMVAPGKNSEKSH